MKRESKLIGKIAEPENLRLAFWKARKAKDGKLDAECFRSRLDANLLSLRQQLLTGKVNVGNYHYFTIYDPKERLICAASFHERVLHHAIMNICHTNFEKFQIFDSYASRKDKGTYAALDRAKFFQRKYKWYLKLDVRKYFDSINHNILKQQIAKRFKDKLLLMIFNDIINSYQTTAGKGIPIGNLTSQYFANHYLAVADHFIKEKLNAPAYVRYMDDMVLWSNDKRELLKLGRLFRIFVETELELVLKPNCLNACDKGLPFLGYLLFPKHVLLNQNSKKRYVSKFELYSEKMENKTWTQAEFQKHILPLIAFVKHANTFNLRKKCIENKNFGYQPKGL
jgi:RNA-directed DNA polymerase